MNSKNTRNNTGICQICGNSFKKSMLYPVELIRPSLSEYIKDINPDWEDKGYICLNDLHKYRVGYVEYLMKKELGETEA